MNAESSNNSAESVDLRRAFIQDQIQEASRVPEGKDPDDPEGKMALVTAVSAAADRCQEASDAAGTESNLKWMVQLCKDQIERPSPRTQFLVPLSTAYHNLGLVQWGLRPPAEAEASMRSAISTLEQLDHIFPKDCGHGIKLVGSMVNLAVLLIEQQRYSGAEQLIRTANSTAARLVDQHPHSAECRAELDKCRELAKQFREKGLGLRSSEPEHAPDPDQSSNGGYGRPLAILVIVGLLKFVYREANKPAPPPPQRTEQEAARAQELLTSTMTTIEYVNDSPGPVTVRVRGRSGRRLQSVYEKLPPGPGQSVQQSTFPFSVTEIIVESNGQAVPSSVDSLLPPGGLSQVRVASDLTATWAKLKDRHPPSDRGMLPMEEIAAKQ